MAKLNYHHLYYFWQVARIGNLTQAAQELHVSQSALSTQIRQLEDNLNLRLFERAGRKLALTEAGQRILPFADDIFTRGDELESLVRRGVAGDRQSLRIGMLPTMSRNFIEGFISPLLDRRAAHFSLRAREIGQLLDDLANHRIDVALTNINVSLNAEQLWQTHLLAQEPISVLGHPAQRPDTPFPAGFESFRWLLPGGPSEIRGAFEAFCSRWQYQPDVQAEVDDMAMLRLLARDSGALAVLPKVVVRDELVNGTLVEYFPLPDTYERFYAVTVKRRYVPEALTELLESMSKMAKLGPSRD